MPTVSLHPTTPGGASAPPDASPLRRAEPSHGTLRAVARSARLSARSAWRPAVEIGLAILGVALLFRRIPLPGGLDFGYRSWARNVALLVLVGTLAGAPGVVLARSRIAAALLGLTLVATASVVSAGGRTTAVSTLWVALGVFHAARAVATDERGRVRLLHGLGLLCVAVLARELWHEPLLLLLREERRHALVTDHPNTLGFAMALLVPVLLGAAARRHLRAAACLYAAAGSAVLLATFSRAAWLALGGAVLALALATLSPRAGRGHLRGKRPSSRARVEIAALAALVLLLAAGMLSRDRAGGDAQRLRILDTSWSIFLEHWPLGVGFGSGNLELHFPARYLERHGESLFLFHSHDLYLDVLTGAGVAGGIAALALLTSLARVAWQGLAAATHRAARLEAAGHATALGVFLLLGLVDTPLYHGRLLLLTVVLWAMLDASTECAVRSHEPKNAASSHARAGDEPDAAERRRRHRPCWSTRQTRVRPRTATTDGP